MQTEVSLYQFNIFNTNKTVKQIINWLKESNRYKHLVGGVIIGMLSNTNYCAALSGIGIAGALEYKDKAHGCVWDWIDFACTIGGVIVGRLIHIAIWIGQFS